MSSKLLQRLLCLFLLSLAGVLHAGPATAEGAFPRPQELERDVAFWRRVYTEVGTDGGFIHDDARLDIVYDVLRFPADLPPSRRSRQIDDAKARIARALRSLGSQGSAGLDADERRIRDLWPSGTPRAEFAAAAERVRFQLGQANRFREGLVRSGEWMPKIVAILERRGLPPELAALPHVESSFNTYAYSKVGAAGMWQFMRSTGRRYLRIDSVVDERLDPYKATEAAAAFLEQNHAVLGSWPLALTAYNHGPAGMRRARESLGTDDIATIVRNYRSRTFGFASRNFYVAFLAAVEIDADPERFFGPVDRAPADASQMTVMPEYLGVQSLAEALDVDLRQLQRLNPALLPAVWSGSRRVPRGYALRVPGHIDVAAALARIPAEARFAGQVAETRHRVERGETLSTIAARHGVSLGVLADLNSLSRPYRIHAGQVLLLPDRAGRASSPAASPVASASAAVAQPAASGQYVVRRGDTLSAIANRHGVTAEQLMRVNGLRGRNVIHVGQVLRVGVDDVAGAAPAPAPAAAVASIGADAAEPVSAAEADEQDPMLVPGVQTAATADPADYSVDGARTVRVEAAETLGHFADWLGIRASTLRALNGMKGSTPLVVGRRLKLDFSRVPVADFEARRLAYHRDLQEAFFAQHRITGSALHVVRSGESLWVLAQQRYGVPLWLLRQYNPDLDLGDVRPGTRLVIPHVEAVDAAEAAAGAS